MPSTVIRERLLKRRQELDARTLRIGSDLRGAVGAVEGGFADQATVHANDAVLDAIGESASKELQQIDSALRRIEEGRYGRCEICGGSIAMDRLEAVPYATTCMACSA
jgi:RNA polymerase-binding transcription factor DksA